MSQEAGTKTGGDPFRAAAPRPGARGLAGILVNWLRSGLFLRTASGPVGPRKVLLAVAAVAAAAATAASAGPSALAR